MEGASDRGPYVFVLRCCGSAAGLPRVEIQRPATGEALAFESLAAAAAWMLTRACENAAPPEAPAPSACVERWEKNDG